MTRIIRAASLVIAACCVVGWSIEHLTRSLRCTCCSFWKTTKTPPSRTSKVSVAAVLVSGVGARPGSASLLVQRDGGDQESWGSDRGAARPRLAALLG
jgi:hypothetical protein